MAWINGTYVDDRPLGHPQQIFVAHESAARVHAFGKQHGIPRVQIDRVLRDACDEDNYHNHVWHPHLANVVFEFYLARLKVELRSIKNL